MSKRIKEIESAKQVLIENQNEKEKRMEKERKLQEQEARDIIERNK